MPRGYSNLTGQNPFKGKKRTPFSEEHLEKLRTSHLGQVAWNKGKSHLKEENNPAWKGNLVGYRNLHHWVTRHKGKPTFCSNNSAHIAPYYHWANISGEYKRDLNDYQSLCPSCNKLDGIRKPERFKI